MSLLASRALYHLMDRMRQEVAAVEEEKQVECSGKP
jgi:hypothetical protein